MEVIRVNVHATPEGRYKTIDVITQIKRMYSNMVTFPEKPLREICLADLKIREQQAFKGISIGVIGTWSDEHMEYMKREFTLYFR